MFKIKVPASSANLGCGFDTLGIALQKYNTFSFRSADTFKLGEGFLDIHRTENNLILSSLKTTLKILKKHIDGVEVGVEIDVPVSRGLGSSATCIIAGVLAAYVLSDTPIDKLQAYQICSDIETHADNIAAALFGGLTLAYKNDEGWQYEKYIPSEEYDFCVFIPKFKLSTLRARKALPKNLTYADCINNIARAALMITALTKPQPVLLKEAVRDKLHQPYRIPLIDEYDAIESFALDNKAYAAFISGAGPSIMTIIDKKNTKSYINTFYKNKKKLFKHQWTALPLSIDKNGVEIIFEE
jgi:homoserine kinase